MRKMLFLLLFILVCTSIYYDITEGTLPTSSPPSATSDSLDDQTIIKVTIEPGQTVLSIVEKLHDGPIPVSIERVTKDFQQLNNDMEPNQIEVDKSYNFPVYEP
ncbi:hypothetical protein D7Z54_05000 [Salibacterium salarium]|uniref:LysM domain-containing protein n=1 Tax=Salibacterium salarium TaxID=284579 RepID=A0A428N805_9BACI|nr:hypothetical protein [Salibacterium salarium]RSL34511.1 hypothetical protein D7Z54_05000 [Salibacterium salarium]